MQGFVLSFRPASGEGTLIAQSGSLHRFTRCARADLHGGDIVDFDPALDRIHDPRLIERWSKRMTSSHRPLLVEFLETVEMDGLPRPGQ